MKEIYPIVMLRDTGIIGHIVEQHAHFSVVKYSIGGFTYVEAVDNEDFVTIDAIVFEHEDEV